jgi:predicted nucleic acid-binding protein
LDDLPARRAAEVLDIQVMSVVGLLLLAKRRQLLAEIRPRLDSLIAMDFRISGRLYRNALRYAMEL